MTSEPHVRVLDADVGPALEIIEGAGEAHAIVWPGMGAALRSLHRISLGEGASTIELSHPGEAVYYVIEGSGEATDPSSGTTHELVQGSMLHVEPGTPYVIGAGQDRLELVGGPSPPDPGMYEQARDRDERGS